jgi:hypothetical protein
MDSIRGIIEFKELYIILCFYQAIISLIAVPLNGLRARRLRALAIFRAGRGRLAEEARWTYMGCCIRSGAGYTFYPQDWNKRYERFFPTANRSTFFVVVTMHTGDELLIRLPVLYSRTSNRQ